MASKRLTTGKAHDVSVRPVVRSDYEQWLRLWEGYNAFYGRSGSTALAADITRMTWSRFFDSYEPVHALVAENDGELLGWMGQQVTGLSAWAEALVDTYEHCTQVIGIDPQASAMLHDVADAAAQAAETMGAAKAKFTEHYELPREFAANGGLMTHDGRWITGDGA